MDAVLKEKLARKLQKQHRTLEELGVGFSAIRELKDAGYDVKYQHSSKGQTYYILTGKEHDSLFLSGRSPEALVARWAELSDFHIGCKQFQKGMLREVLQRAVDEGIKEAFISGDLTDGYGVYKGQPKNLNYILCEDQAKYCAEILMDYPLNYYAISGNHDEAWERKGGTNPIARVEHIVNQERTSKASFVFLNAQAADIIFMGVCYRMVHLSGGSAYAKSYPGQVYLRNLIDAHGENVWISGNKYRLRFLQLGHLHTNVAYEAGGIHITHPGNFQTKNDFTIRKGLVGDQGGRFTECTIVNGMVFEYGSRFIKPYCQPAYVRFKGGKLLPNRQKRAFKGLANVPKRRKRKTA